MVFLFCLAVPFIVDAAEQSIKTYTPKLITHQVVSAYVGDAATVQALQSGQVQPLSLAAGDFDADGIEDVVIGFGGTQGGIVALHRGNVDSIYPNSPAGKERKSNGFDTEAPFLSPAHVFALPEPADFLGAGDFDKDGHWDIVSVAKGSKLLYLLPGNGKGEFGAIRYVALPGFATSLVAGKMNRSDGLVDVAVGVTGEKTSQALVYESHDGAFNGKPEAFPLPAPATELALGHMDEDYLFDLVVAAGKDLVVIHGRDRTNSTLKAATVEQRAMPSEVRSIALLDYDWDREPDLATLTADGVIRQFGGGKRKDVSIQMLSGQGKISAAKVIRARMSASPGDDLIALDRDHNKLHLLIGDSWKRSPSQHRPLPVSLDLESKPVAALPMRLNGDALNDLVVLLAGSHEPVAILTAPAAVFTVDDPGDGSDEAIGDGQCSVSDGVNCTLRAAIEEANASPGSDTIDFSVSGTIHPTLADFDDISEDITIDGGNNITLLADSVSLGISVVASNSTIRGIDVNNCDFLCILFSPANNGIIEHVNINGSQQQGIQLVDSSNSMIVQSINIDGAADVGILLNNGTVDLHSNLVTNCGVGIRGNNLSNSSIDSQNRIYNSNSSGIWIDGSNNTIIQSNHIGEFVTLGNGGEGVLITSNNTTVEFNEILNNGTDGVNIHSGTGNSILGNSILGGGKGIHLSGGNNNQAPPSIASADISGGTTTVTASMGGSGSETFRIEFFHNSGCPGAGNEQGETFLGFKNVSGGTTNFTFSTNDGNGDSITATATSMKNANTSEFSNCVTAGTPTCPITLKPAKLFDGTVGTDYDETITASRGTGSYTFQFDPTKLPPGIQHTEGPDTLSLSGKPNKDGTFVFDVSATDANCTVTQTYSITIGTQGGGTVELPPVSDPEISRNTVETTAAQWLDFNGDGQQDFLLIGKNGNALFENVSTNSKPAFKDVTLTLKVGNGGAGASGAASADMDNDGDIDILIANTTGPLTLLKKSGPKGKPYVDASNDIQSSFSTRAGAGERKGVIWFDCNRDEFVDAFVIYKNAPNELLENRNGTLVDVAHDAGVDDSGPGRGAVAADFDGDGDQDLYVVNFKKANKLYINDGNCKFEDKAKEAKVGFRKASVQAVVNDFDGDPTIDPDGLPNPNLDLFVVNSKGSSILLKNRGVDSNGKLTFKKVTGKAGLKGPKRGKAAAFLDVDNDGDQDLVLVQSTGGNFLFRNDKINDNSIPKFTKLSVNLDDPDNPSGLSTADFDGDGQVDIGIGDEDQQSNDDHGDTIYQNSTDGGNNFLQIVLVGKASNKSVINAKVVVQTQFGFQAQTVSGGSGQNQESLPLEFGLGTQDHADSVIVIWPSGTTPTQRGPEPATKPNKKPLKISEP